MSADSEKPNIIGVIGRNIALWQNLWVGGGRFDRRSSSAHASLALCGRFNQFRSPYSWITMRRALRKRRVFDFVPSYLKTILSRIMYELESVRTDRQRVHYVWHNAGTTPVTENTREGRNVSVFGKSLDVYGCTPTREESQIRQERCFS